MTGAAGLADLLRVYRAHGGEALEVCAAALGLPRRPARPPVGPGVEEASQQSPAASGGGGREAGERSPEERRPVPQWRLEATEYIDEGEPRELPPKHSAREHPPLVARDWYIDVPAQRCVHGVPLNAWARLWPAVQRLLRRPQRTRRVDVARWMHGVARGVPVVRVPFRWRQAEPAEVVVLADRSEHLAPLWRDQGQVVADLERQVGRGAVRAEVILEGDPLPAVCANAVVLALTDLGAHGAPEERARWLRWGAELDARSVARGALVPAIRRGGRGAELCTWPTARWEAGLELRPRADAAEVLLDLLSWASRVEWELLRRLRRAVFGAEADVQVELAIARHPDRADGGGPGIALLADAARARWERARGLPDAWKREAATLVVQAHRDLPPEVRACEVLAGAAVLGVSAFDPGVVAEAGQLVLRMATTADHPEASGALEARLRVWWRQATDRMPGAALRPDDEVGRAWAQVRRWSHEGVTHDSAAGDVDLLQVYRDDARGRQPAWWTVLQAAEGLVALPAAHAWQLAPGAPKGSPLAAVRAQSPHLFVREVRARREHRVPLGAGAVLLPVTPAAGGLVLRSDLTPKARLVVHEGGPAWAADWGRDRFGLWAELEVRGAAGAVRQRLRWIPPGRFWMGSPPEEPGRYEAEGPRHLVTLSRGYWLADTPCTQELWVAVMGSNPSEFQTPRRPVEKVSWPDVQAFMAKLGGQQEGEDEVFRLPTEAEWEYACRAGTEAATYAGPIELRGDNDAPVLDAIAWYGGNSGYGLEPGLKSAVDSSGWSHKQREHTRAATREVKGKLPNPWGLYDTLGNVWEWCEDGRRTYEGRPERDPWGPAPSEIQWPAARGGSWGTDARRVRAAYRNDVHPSAQWRYLGFRLARGQRRG